MATFNPQMLRDLLNSPDPKDQEFARMLSEQEFSNENGRLANYPSPSPYASQFTQAPTPPPIIPPMPTPPMASTVRGPTNAGGPTPDQMAAMDAANPPKPAVPTYPQTDQIMTSGSQPIPLDVGGNAFDQAAARRQMYGPGDTAPIAPGSGSWTAGDGQSSGKFSAPAGQAATQTTTPNIRVLDQMRQKDGSIFQMIEQETPRGMVRSTRVVMPDELDPYKQAKAKADKLAAETRALSPQGIQDAAKAKKAGEDSANQERRARLTPAQRAAEDYKATGGKLAVDQEVDPETGAVRAKVGSKLYVAQKNAHAADLNAAAVVGDSVDAAVKKIDRILADKEGFASNFGGYNAKYGTQYFPDAQNAKKNIDSLKADMKKAGLEIMRSGGSIGMMTEREWPIVEAQIAAIDPLLSEDEAKVQLQAVADRLNTIKTRAADKYKTEWSEHPFYKGAKTEAPGIPKMGTVKNGYVFKGGDPSKQENWMRQ